MSINLFATNLKEIQEVRIAKAQLLIIDSRDQEALNLLKKNIIGKKYHIDSFFVLAGYFFERNKLNRGLQICRLLVKKIYGSAILSAKSINHLKEILEQYPLKMSAKAIVFKLAETYLEEVEKQTIPSRKKRLLLLARKYFTIAKLSSYKKGMSSYYLGTIDQKSNNIKKAISNLVDAKENLSETEDEEALENIEYLLGTLLIEDGKLDSGILFMKSIYHRRKSSPALREYADAYLEALSSKHLVSLGVSTGIQNNNNVHYLTEKDLNRFKLFEEK